MGIFSFPLYIEYFHLVCVTMITIESEYVQSFSLKLLLHCRRVFLHKFTQLQFFSLKSCLKGKAKGIALGLQSSSADDETAASCGKTKETN